MMSERRSNAILHCLVLDTLTTLTQFPPQ